MSKMHQAHEVAKYFTREKFSLPRRFGEATSRSGWKGEERAKAVRRERVG